MSIHLQYRIEGQRINCLSKVYIEPADEPWIFDQIAAEISALFPDAIVRELPERQKGGDCDLLIFPYQRNALGPRKISEKVQTARPCRPKLLMFYGLAHRSVDVVSWPDAWTFWFSRAVEKILRCVLHPRQTVSRLVRGLARRSRSQLWQRRETRDTRQ